jgi:secreted PhoX family phosphatase
MRDMIAGRLSRRGFLGGAAALPLLSLAGCATASGSSRTARLPVFGAVAPTNADTVTVPPGFRVQTLIAWGDPLYEGQAAFDPDALSRFEQEARFGMNNDMLALFPLSYAFPTPSGQNRYLLCVNHEYAGAEMMFPTTLESLAAITPAQYAALMASMGCSVVEISRAAPGKWRNTRANAR